MANEPTKEEGDYTPEQIADYTEREQKGMELLKELNLFPAALVTKDKVGTNLFADRVTCFLGDTKFSKNESNTKTSESVEAERTA